MKPSEFQKTVQCRFDCMVHLVVKGCVRDYRKELQRRKNKEALFCELPDLIIEKMATCNEYDSDYTLFRVCGIDIRIYDEKLAKALQQLSERNRTGMLMYYFLEMSDTEISKLQQISRSGVYQNRQNTLTLMKQLLEEG